MHEMNVLGRIITFLNPGQIPAIAMDQPLFAVGKLNPWNFPEKYGEDKYVIMLGGLHIEMAAFKTLGDWFDGSGWTSVLVQSGVASTGVAESFLKVSHLMRTRHAHQVTAASLHVLKKEAYQLYTQVTEDDPPMDFQLWCADMRQKSPQFEFWSKILDFELLILLFIHSLREGNFELYVETLSQLAKCFFALDHTTVGGGQCIAETWLC